MAASPHVGKNNFPFPSARVFFAYAKELDLGVPSVPTSQPCNTMRGCVVSVHASEAPPSVPILSPAVPAASMHAIVAPLAGLARSRLLHPSVRHYSQDVRGGSMPANRPSKVSAGISSASPRFQNFPLPRRWMSRRWVMVPSEA